MKHWSQLATRNWRTRPARSLLAVSAIALGVGVVVWVTCCYESVRLGITNAVLEWVGRSHVIVEHKNGVWGTFGEDLVEQVADVPGIEHITKRTREYVEAAPGPRDPVISEPGRPRPGPARNEPSHGPSAHDQPQSQRFIRIEITGIIPEREQTFRTHKLAQGRFIQPGDTDAIVIERLLAKEFDVGLGDTIHIRHHEPPQPLHAFKIVGIADRRRASVNQAPMAWTRLDHVQRICKLPGRIKAIDIILEDPTAENIRHTADLIRTIIDEHDNTLRGASASRRPAQGRDAEGVVVKTTEAQHKKLGAAKGLLQFIMLLLSCVVLLTAFFIILATMSMGVTEQITQLGLLRCVGLTRLQLGILVLLQTLPFGILGTLAGVPLGLGLHWLTVQLNPEYLGDVAVNHAGILLAVVGGIGTTLLGAVVPSLSAFFVSPVEAARAHTGGRLARWVWALACVGAALIVVHEIVRWDISRTTAAAAFNTQAVVSLVLLYTGAAMIAPAVVVAFGRLVIRVAAVILRLQPQLLGDEIAKAPYRAASICCGLMVALSLIVGLVVWGESVKQGWQFPKEFPDAMLYSYEPRPIDEILALADTEGITDFTALDDFAFLLSKPKKHPFLRRIQELESFNRFLAIDPETGFAIIKLAFVEGNVRDAAEKLRQGGHILVTREFAQAHDPQRHIGDTVPIWARTADGDYAKVTFTIAGIIASPGVDIAVSYFNASAYFQTYAVGAVFGSLGDAERHFGRNTGKMMLFNFAPGIKSSRVEADSSQAIVPITSTTEGGRPTFAAGSGPVPGDGPEERIINDMLRRLDYPSKAFVTARELKQQIDRSISSITLLLSAIPAVGLIIAALGVANLMAASVASRARQTAVLRAVGVTKNQVSRIVIGEALVLGLLGSVMGLALGLGLGRTSNLMTELLSGFHPEFKIPWDMLAAGAALATGLCVLAALVPARYASRSNIVAALSEG